MSRKYAFPAPNPHAFPGMTLRDYFAARAMQGLLSNHSVDHPEADVVRLAYEIADLMLTARQSSAGGG